MPEEQTLIRACIVECETRMVDQRAQIAQLTTAGADASSAINVLSALESTQALRLRRLAALV